MGWEIFFDQVDNMSNVDTNGKDWFNVDQKGQVIFIYMGNFRVIPNTFQSDAAYSNFSRAKLNPMLKTLTSVNMRIENLTSCFHRLAWFQGMLVAPAIMIVLFNPFPLHSIRLSYSPQLSTSPISLLFLH